MHALGRLCSLDIPVTWLPFSSGVYCPNGCTSRHGAQGQIGPRFAIVAEWWSFSCLSLNVDPQPSDTTYNSPVFSLLMILPSHCSTSQNINLSCCARVLRECIVERGARFPHNPSLGSIRVVYMWDRLGRNWRCSENDWGWTRKGDVSMSWHICASSLLEENLPCNGNVCCADNFDVMWTFRSAVMVLWFLCVSYTLVACSKGTSHFTNQWYDSPGLQVLG